MYEPVSEDGRLLIKAVSRGTAAAYYREEDIDIREYPFMSWGWKVTEASVNLKEREKSGDDFPARVYVVVKTGIFPWQVVAFNYVWSMNSSSLQQWPSPYTDRVIMKAVDRGKAALGQWRTHKVNVLEDLKQILGDEVSEINGVAIMTDMDNTGVSATVYYGEITFSRN